MGQGRRAAIEATVAPEGPNAGIDTGTGTGTGQQNTRIAAKPAVIHLQEHLNDTGIESGPELGAESENGSLDVPRHAENGNAAGNASICDGNTG